VSAPRRSSRAVSCGSTRRSRSTSGPAGACLAAGIRPEALARVIAALAYDEESDRQASDLRRELEFLEPEEVLSGVSTLDRNDELTRLVCQHYHTHISEEVAH
jgi:hypothetical protein